MTHRMTWLVVVVGLGLWSPDVRGDGPERTKVLVHVMPWFVAKPASPVWGWHWTMNHFDPDQVRDGRRPIAAHDAPVIGPYDSGDPAVIEYQLLSMKLAGIDGIILDWYGRVDHLDYGVIHRNAGLLVEAATRFGLTVGVCYEDRTIPVLVAAGKVAAADRVAHARGEVEWLRTHWLAGPSAIRFDGRPVVLSFGFDGLSDREWEQALPPGVVYLSEHRRRPGASGAFDWPIPPEGVASTARFARESDGWPLRMPVAYPRFHDIYAEAKLHPSYGRIPDDDGRTFTTTLDRALATRAPFVQVATWNDWGEGTAIEPSVEHADRDLRVIQSRRRQLDPGFRPTVADLGLPLALFHARRDHPDPARTAQLDAAARHAAEGRADVARKLLDRPPIPTRGDSDR